MTNTTKTTPHVRLDTSDLRNQYHTGKLTIKGYVYNWLLASRKRGWKLRTTVKEFCTELGISRAAFYKAIADLKFEPGSNFHFEAHGEIEMWLEDEPSTIVDTESTIVDTESTIVDTESTIVDTESTIVENETLKASHSKASSVPSTTSHLFYNLKTDLPQATADESFVEQPTANFPNRANYPGSVSYRLDVAQILEETRKRLQEQVWIQANKVNHKRGLIGASPVETQGSSLIPDQSDPITTTT